MFFARSAAGAVSSALDALNALSSSKSSAKRTGDSQNAANPFELSPSDAQAPVFPGSGSGGGSDLRLSAQMQIMSALLDAQSQSNSNLSSLSMRSKPLKEWFAKIDGYGDGQITKSEFEALGTGGNKAGQADSVFGKLDTDGDGSVSLTELASALKAGKKDHHDHDKAGDGDGSGSDPFSQAVKGASSTSVTNSDGSVTTSLTYADGSKVTMTSAAGKSSSASATSSYNFIERMIQRQAQATSSGATGSLSVST